MHAATQNRRGTIGALVRALPQQAVPVATGAAMHGPSTSAAVVDMPAATPRLFKIQGITREGKAFRPGDWAERLAGALASFRPPGVGVDAHIRYSPYCMPRVVGGVKCVIVNEALRDNELLISESAPGEQLA